MTEDKIAEVEKPDSPVFDERERAVLKFTEAMCRNERDKAETLVEDLRQFFDEAAIVEMGFAITTLIGMNLFNNVFHIEPESTPMVSYTGVDKKDNG